MSLKTGKPLKNLWLKQLGSKTQQQQPRLETRIPGDVHTDLLSLQLADVPDEQAQLGAQNDAIDVAQFTGNRTPDGGRGFETGDINDPLDAQGLFPAGKDSAVPSGVMSWLPPVVGLGLVGISSGGESNSSTTTTTTTTTTPTATVTAASVATLLVSDSIDLVNDVNVAQTETVEVSQGLSQVGFEGALASYQVTVSDSGPTDDELVQVVVSHTDQATGLTDTWTLTGVTAATQAAQQTSTPTVLGFDGVAYTVAIQGTHDFALLMQQTAT